MTLLAIAENIQNTLIVLISAMGLGGLIWKLLLPKMAAEMAAQMKFLSGDEIGKLVETKLEKEKFVTSDNLRTEIAELELRLFKSIIRRLNGGKGAANETTY